MGLQYKELTTTEGSQMHSGFSLKGGNSTVRYVVQDDGTAWPAWINTVNYLIMTGVSYLGHNYVRDSNWVFGDVPGTHGWILTDGWPNPQDLAALPTDLLGYVNLNSGLPGNGAINRTTPRIHPSNPYWTASSITNMTGIGPYVLAPAVSILFQNVQTRQMPQWAFYKAYLVQVEFVASVYSLLPNNVIQVSGGARGSWCYFDGNFVFYKFANEWIRYTNFEMEGQYNNITMPKGMMTFQDTAVAPAPVTNNVPFPAPIRMFVPDIKLKFYWHTVPFRYYTSVRSYLRRFVGLINQNPWNPAGFVGSAYLPGQVMYLGCKTSTYTPPVPMNVLIALGAFDAEKLCDLELEFLVTSRFCTTTLAAGSSSYAHPLNNNWICSGHNLQPSHIDRKFHYARIGPLGTPAPTLLQQYPTWFSFPFELLFTDPDFAQPLGVSPLEMPGPGGIYPVWQSSTAVSP